MEDQFSGVAMTLSDPATRIEEVIPNDTTDIGRITRGLMCTLGGTVRVTTLGGDTATVPLAEGAVLPIRVTRIWATGTTASGIVALS